MRQSCTRLGSMLIAAIAACALSAAAAPEAPFDGRLVLQLDDALAQGYKGGDLPPQARKTIELHATCVGGKWSDVWAYGRDFNASIHLGEVTEANVREKEFKIKLKLDVASDNWIKGGLAEYDIDLKRVGNKVSGTFSGTFAAAGAQVWAPQNAAVQGYVLEPNVPRAGFVPVKPGEHPRLLFRKSELPALRERAKTPFGKAIIDHLKNSSDPVALGFMYQLTGDTKYAERAYPEAVKVMKNRDGGAFALGRFWGYRTMVVGNTYDLCYDAWTPAQREVTENYLDDILDLCLNRKHRVGTVNWSPGSNYTAVIHGGNGAAALALWGEKSPAPAEPPAPRTETARLSAPSGLKAGTGVPTVGLPVGQTPTEWLWIGPFDLHSSAGDDCLASAGGVEKARPQQGDTVAFKSQKLQWQPLSRATHPEAFGETPNGPPGSGLKEGQPSLLTPKLAGGEQKRLFFYSIMSNPTSGYYRFQANFWNGTCYIDGQRFSDGDIVYLNKGQYPWMVPVSIGSPTGFAAPYFVEATEEQAKAFDADKTRIKTYEANRNAWQRSMDSWKATGGTNLTWLRNVRTLAAWNYLNLQLGMGDGGFQGEGEGYTLECHHMPHDYACIAQVATGISPSGRPDIDHFAARYVHDALWRKDGRGEHAFQYSYGGHGGGTMPDYYFSRAIVLAPEAWRPALLWHWLKQNGVTHEQVVSGESAGKLIDSRGHDDSLTPIWTFLNYPLDMIPKNPEGVLPKVWESEARGYYSFRDHWKGGDDMVASIYGRQGASCGWSQNETGCFQIYGLGGEWAYKSNDASGKTGSRWLDNVVMLPDDPINASGRGRSRTSLPTSRQAAAWSQLIWITSTNSSLPRERQRRPRLPRTPPQQIQRRWQNLVGACHKLGR